MRIHVLVLNYNGRRLLAECLPSLLEAARASRHGCELLVVDNNSTDDSVAWLGEHFPEIPVVRRSNRGLASLNDVVAALDGPVAILLNNDIKLAPGAIDPLVAPLLDRNSTCFMTAPQCRLFDGTTYEGFKTAVRWRWGLVQATALYPGHEHSVDEPDLTASAGAALAVRRAAFTEIGGFDPLYLPGRLEDLDFCFRGWMAGYHGRYVPASVAYHRGMATFGAVYGINGCSDLALRNTLLFQWKNLRHPVHRIRQLVALPVRMGLDLARAPWAAPQRRWPFFRAFFAARARRRAGEEPGFRAVHHGARERAFFRRFHPRRMQSGEAKLARVGPACFTHVSEQPTGVFP
jgi:GT2 family glycosyltransferase